MNTDEVLNEAAIRLAMSNQNNAGPGFDPQSPVPAQRRPIFPPIRETGNAEEARRGRAERRGGERRPPPMIPLPLRRSRTTRR